MPEDEKKTSQPPKDAMGMLEYYLVDKAPFQLPGGVKEWIVKYGPWIDIVLLVLLAPAILLALGLGAVVLPFSGTAAPALGVGLLLLVLQVGLMVFALPGLFARKMSGWNLLFYSSVLSLIVEITKLNILGGLLGALISFYLLFQIRSYYK